MAFDLSTLFDVSHLLTFVGGAMVGAAGTYLGDRFTDSRRAKEARAETRASFNRLHEQMPDLLCEMRSDLQAPESSLIREFALLANPRLVYDHSKPRFQYYFESYPQLHPQVDLLVAAGFVEQLDSPNVPMYRMKENFVDILIKR